MIFKDYYKILGLENSRVSLDEIKMAYRRQAKKYHPDVNIGNKKNEEIFKDINEAYKVLSTPTSKRKYDRTWNRRVGKKYKSTTYDKKLNTKDSVFNMFFGNVEEPKPVKKEALRGENIRTEVNISIEDAFRGKQQTIAVRTVDGDLKTLKVDLPAGIQNNEKIRLVGQRKTWSKWWKKWRFVYMY